MLTLSPQQGKLKCTEVKALFTSLSGLFNCITYLCLSDRV